MARLGRGQMVRVCGEPGVGKSRLADALANRAAAKATPTIWVKAWERSYATPHGVVLDCLDAHARRGEIDVGRQHRRSLDERTTVRTGAQLFESLSSALVKQAETTLVVIDDLHAADLDSLELLIQLAPALQCSRTLLVATERSVDTDASDEALALLDALSRLTLRVELGGLDVATVARLIEELSGRVTDPRTAQAVHRATLGNALFVEGVVRAAIREGTLDAGTIRVPPDVRRAIEARVRRLGDDAAGLLRVAALLGRPCSVSLLAAATGHAAEAVEALLERSIEAALFDPPREGRYAFRHSLVAEAIVASMAPAERTQLHAHIAAVLERFEGTQASLFELAFHRSRAASVVGVEEALLAMERAALEASRLCAHEEAVRYRRELLALLEAHAPSDSARRAGALLAVAEAWTAAGKRGLARAPSLEAAELARKLGDATTLARAALALAETGEFGAIDREKLGWLEAALALLEADQGVLRFRVLTRLSRELWSDPKSTARRREVTRELLATARELHDPRLLWRALDARFQALWGPNGHAERAEILQELRALAGAFDDTETYLDLHRHALLIAAETGNLALFSEELNAFVSKAEPLKRPALAETIVQRRLLLTLAHGEVSSTERLISSYRELSEAVQNPQAEMGYRFIMSLLAADTGKPDELAALVPGFLLDAERLPNLPFVRARLANVCALLGRTDEARRQLETVLAHSFASLNEDVSTLACLAFLAESAWLLEDAASAAILYERLAPHRHLVVSIGSTLCLGAAERYLGLLSWTLGRRDEAIEALTRAHATHRRMKSPPWAARSGRELAQLLTERGQSADVAPARELQLEYEHHARSGIAPLGAPRAPSLITQARAPTATASLIRNGEIWALEFASNTTRMRDAKGLRVLAALLATPGREQHVLELVGASAIRQEGMSAEPVLDAKARASYRARIAQLREAADEAAERGDTAAQLRAREELEALDDELRRVTGLGGRARSSGAPERARVAVAKALERTMKALESHHPAAFAHLTRSLRTGLFCVYDPDPSASIAWTVRS